MMGKMKHCYNSDSPTETDIGKRRKEERMNIFRGFFATSRYNRLLIQKILVKCAFILYHKVVELEANHNRNYLETQKMIECYGYMEEFVAAVKEEETALDKIIDAYHRRMRKT
jgi:transcription termination factor NusB